MKALHQKGFTLLELLFTLAIAGIVLALAVPALTQFTQNDRLKSLSMNLHFDLMLARSKSVERNIETIVCPSTNQTSCTASSFNQGWITGIDEDNSGTIDNGEELLSVNSNINDTVSFSSTIGNVIQFDSRGFHPNSSGVISICDSRGTDYAKTLSISRTGRVSRGAAPSCP